MVCPNCGCEQRAREKCVHCHVTIPAHLAKEVRTATIHVTAPPAREIEKRLFQDVPPPPASPPPSPQRVSLPPMEREIKKSDNPIRVVIPGRTTSSQKSITQDTVLVTTTQQIEGKKISTYFGLISANATIDPHDRNATESPASAYDLRDVMDQKSFRHATFLALRRLREEAASLGANAVVATALIPQQIADRPLPIFLLCAAGTAVYVEDLK